jgi:hypothetical protein
VKERKRGVGDPHRAVGSGAGRGRVGGAPGLLLRRGRPLGGERGDACGQVPVPFFAQLGDGLPIGGAAVGVEDGRDGRLPIEACDVAEALLGERAGEGVDAFAKLLELPVVHGRHHTAP